MNRYQARARTQRTFDRAQALLLQEPGQFERVRDALREEAAKDSKQIECPSLQTLKAWWQVGLMQETGRSVELVQVRPPISDSVRDHLALREEAASHEAGTMRRELRRAAANNAKNAVPVLVWQQAFIYQLGKAMRDQIDPVTKKRLSVGLDTIAVKLAESLAQDLSNPETRMTPAQKHDWLVRLIRLKSAMLSVQRELAQTEALVGGGDRPTILGLSGGPGMEILPPAGQGSGQTPAADPLADLTPEAIEEQALRIAESMAALRQAPEGLDQAIEAEVSASR